MLSTVICLNFHLILLRTPKKYFFLLKSWAYVIVEMSLITASTVCCSLLRAAPCDGSFVPGRSMEVGPTFLHLQNDTSVNPPLVEGLVLNISYNEESHCCRRGRRESIFGNSDWLDKCVLYP